MLYITNIILLYRNRLKTNELVGRIDVNEELKFDYDSLISVHKSYQLDAEYIRKNELNAFASTMQLFKLKITDLRDGNDIFQIKGLLPDQVFNLKITGSLTLNFNLNIHYNKDSSNS